MDALKFYGRVLGMFLLLSAMVAYDYLVRGAHREHQPVDRLVPAADADRGRILIREYGCGSCHTVPGVPNAIGRVGPPLYAMRTQIYVAGVLPNTPQHMTKWIMDPQDVNPRTVMPDLDVTNRDARDMTAFLYEIEQDR